MCMAEMISMAKLPIHRLNSLAQASAVEPQVKGCMQELAIFSLFMGLADCWLPHGKEKLREVPHLP